MGVALRLASRGKRSSIHPQHTHKNKSKSKSKTQTNTLLSSATGCGLFDRQIAAYSACAVQIELYHTYEKVHSKCWPCSEESESGLGLDSNSPLKGVWKIFALGSACHWSLYAWHFTAAVKIGDASAARYPHSAPRVEFFFRKLSDASTLGPAHLGPVGSSVFRSRSGRRGSGHQAGEKKLRHYIVPPPCSLARVLPSSSRPRFIIIAFSAHNAATLATFTAKGTFLPLPFVEGSHASRPAFRTLVWRLSPLNALRRIPTFVSSLPRIQYDSTRSYIYHFSTIFCRLRS